MEPSKTPLPGTLTPDIVSDIPLQTQAAPAAKPVTEDDELDKIMHDVGDDLKQIGKRPAKKHFDFFGHKSKPKSKPPSLPAQPVAAAQPLPAPAPKPPAAQAKPKKTSGAPVMLILVVIVITGALAAAAYYAYK